MTAMKDANNKIADTFKQEMSKILNVWQKQRFFIESKINDLKLELTQENLPKNLPPISVDLQVFANSQKDLKK